MIDYVLGISPAHTTGWGLMEVASPSGECVLRGHGQCGPRAPAIRAVVATVSLLVPTGASVVLAVAGTQRLIGRRWEETIKERRWSRMLIEQESWRRAVYGGLPDKPLRQDQWRERAATFVGVSMGLDLPKEKRHCAEGVLIAWYYAEYLRACADID